MNSKKKAGIVLGILCAITALFILIPTANKNEDKKSESQRNEREFSEADSSHAVERETAAKSEDAAEHETEGIDPNDKKDEILIFETVKGNKIETEYIPIDHKFYLKIPKNFEQLDYDIITQKYSGDIPDMVFSNEEANINVAISLTENRIKNSQIDAYTDYMEQLFSNYCEVVDTNSYTIGNYNVGQIKLISDAVDTQIYNNMIYFSYHDKLIIVAFNCTEKLMDEWMDAGDFIIDSLAFEE